MDGIDSTLPSEDKNKSQEGDSGNFAEVHQGASQALALESMLLIEQKATRQLSGRRHSASELLATQEAHVQISKDHCAEVKSDLEYESLLEQTPHTLCTLFYSGSSGASKALVQAVKEQAKSLNGKVIFGLVDADQCRDWVAKCGLTKQVPAIVLADNNKSYIHLYTHMTDMSTLKRRIDRYDRGEKKEPQ